MNSEFEKTKLPTGWKWVKLGEVCEVIAGQSPLGTTYRKKPEGLPFFQGKADFADLHPVARTWCVAPKKVALPGDMLLSVRAPVGPTNVADIECCIGRGLAAIRCTELTDRVFILYFFRLYEDKITRMGTGSTFQSINRNDIENLKIPLPPLPEQKRIAGILAKQMAAAVKAKEACQEKLEAAEKLPASYLNAMFNSKNAKQWPKKKLSEVCEFVGGMQPPKYTFKYEPAPNHVRLVQIQDFRISDAKVYIPKEHARRSFREDDVMIGRYGPPVFQILRGLSGAYNVALMKTVPKNGLLKEFLYFLLQETNIQKAVIEQSQRSAGQSGVQKSFLENYEAYLPEITEQKRIARILTKQMAAVEKATSVIEEELELINKLPASLLQQAFSGKL